MSVIPNTLAPQIVTGIVREATTTPGQTIGQPRYTIEVVWPMGGASMVPGQRAGFQLFATDIEADPAILIGSAVGGLYVAGNILWLFPDPPKHEYCGGQAPLIDPETGEPILPIVPTSLPTASPGSPGPSPTPAPPPGD